MPLNPNWFFCLYFFRFMIFPYVLKLAITIRMGSPRTTAGTKRCILLGSVHTMTGGSAANCRTPLRSLLFSMALKSQCDFASIVTQWIAVKSRKQNRRASVTQKKSWNVKWVAHAQPSKHSTGDFDQTGKAKFRQMRLSGARNAQL